MRNPVRSERRGFGRTYLAGFLLKLGSAEVKPVPERQDLVEKRAQGA